VVKQLTQGTTGLGPSSLLPINTICSIFKDKGDILYLFYELTKLIEWKKSWLMQSYLIYNSQKYNNMYYSH